MQCVQSSIAWLRSRPRLPRAYVGATSLSLPVELADAQQMKAHIVNQPLHNALTQVLTHNQRWAFVQPAFVAFPERSSYCVSLLGPRDFLLLNLLVTSAEAVICSSQS